MRVFRIDSSIKVILSYLIIFNLCMWSTLVTTKIIDFALKSLDLHINFNFFLRPTSSLELFGIIHVNSEELQYPQVCRTSSYLVCWAEFVDVIPILTVQCWTTAFQYIMDSFLFYRSHSLSKVKCCCKILAMLKYLQQKSLAAKGAYFPISNG